MNKSEAMQHGLGYAAGREDASGIPTKTGQQHPERPAFMAFADAYAEGWDDYNNERRYYMTNARDAYDTWQATSGRTIFSNERTCACTPTHLCGNCKAHGYQNSLAGYAARIYPQRVTDAEERAYTASL